MNNFLVSFQRVMERLRELSDGFLVDEVQGPCPIIGDLTDAELYERGFEDSVFVSVSFCEPPRRQGWGHETCSLNEAGIVNHRLFFSLLVLVNLYIHLQQVGIHPDLR